MSRFLKTSSIIIAQRYTALKKQTPSAEHIYLGGVKTFPSGITAMLL